MKSDSLHHLHFYKLTYTRSELVLTVWHSTPIKCIQITLKIPLNFISGLENTNYELRIENESELDRLGRASKSLTDSQVVGNFCGMLIFLT